MLAGVLSALRATEGQLADQKFLFLGAGEAGVGIAELIATAISTQAGCTMEEARTRCLFLDSKVGPLSSFLRVLWIATCAAIVIISGLHAA